MTVILAAMPLSTFQRERRSRIKSIQYLNGFLHVGARRGGFNQLLSKQHALVSLTHFGGQKLPSIPHRGIHD